MEYFALAAAVWCLIFGPSIPWKTKPKVQTPGESSEHRIILVWGIRRLWGIPLPCIRKGRMTKRYYWEEFLVRGKNNPRDCLR